jgi:hypothetical protein
MLAVAACHDDGTQLPTACERGGDIFHEAVAALQRQQPPCSRDDDCVVLRAEISCPQIHVGSCGAIMHRSAAEGWSPEAVCERIDEETVPGQYGCLVQPACSDLGRPVCLDGGCVGAASSDLRGSSSEE